MGNSCLLSETLSGRQLHMREIEGDEWRSRDWWVTICAIQVQSMWDSITTTPFKKYCSYIYVSHIHILCVKSSWWSCEGILFLCRYHGVLISWCRYHGADIMVPMSWCRCHGVLRPNFIRSLLLFASPFYQWQVIYMPSSIKRYNWIHLTFGNDIMGLFWIDMKNTTF